MTDNGSCYRSKAFRDHVAIWALITLRTDHIRPKTNGKAALHPSRAERMGLRAGLAQLRAASSGAAGMADGAYQVDFRPQPPLKLKPRRGGGAHQAQNTCPSRYT
jgi:hypothetical protein